MWLAQHDLHDNYLDKHRTLENGETLYVEAETNEDELSRISNSDGKETSAQKFEDALLIAATQASLAQLEQG
ncbi:MAG: hypothetical protein JG718_11755 [Candidatus Thiothrix moscowensis]|nr:hypothetical protein [Candidatus Thiothrix moscowensis]